MFRFEESTDSSMLAVAAGRFGLGLAKSPDGKVGFRFSFTGGLDGARDAAEQRHFELSKDWAKALPNSQVRSYAVAYAAALDALEAEHSEAAEAAAESYRLMVRILDREIESRNIECGNFVLAA